MFIVLVVVGLAWAKPNPLSPISDFAHAVITKFNNNNNGLGEYTYEVQSTDGQSRGETRTVQNAGTDQETSVVRGYYSYIGDDGKEYLVGYQADENGFQPEAEHLPPAASVKRQRPQLGIPSAAVASLAGGGLG